MNNLFGNPSFPPYALACVVLCGNLFFLWAFSGVVRNKVKSTPNAATYERTLAFGKSLLEFIQPRSGADMIDVQAFIAAIVE